MITFIHSFNILQYHRSINIYTVGLHTAD